MEFLRVTSLSMVKVTMVNITVSLLQTSKSVVVNLQRHVTDVEDECPIDLLD